MKPMKLTRSKHSRASVIASVLLVVSFTSPTVAQKLSREQWGGPAITVTHAGGNWIIAGKRNKVTLNEADLSLRVDAGTTLWTMAPSAANDMLVKSHGNEATGADIAFANRLAAPNNSVMTLMALLYGVRPGSNRGQTGVRPNSGASAAARCRIWLCRRLP